MRSMRCVSVSLGGFIALSGTGGGRKGGGVLSGRVVVAGAAGKRGGSVSYTIYMVYTVHQHN